MRRGFRASGTNRTRRSPALMEARLSSNVAEVELGRNGHFGIVDREGPKLTYETNDQRELYDLDNELLAEMKASAYDARMPYPAAWGEVACTELHGHINDRPDEEVIVRSWRTGAHQYSAVAVYRKDEKSEVAAQQFLDSIRPTGEYKKCSQSIPHLA